MLKMNFRALTQLKALTAKILRRVCLFQGPKVYPLYFTVNHRWLLDEFVRKGNYLADFS